MNTLVISWAGNRDEERLKMVKDDVDWFGTVISIEEECGQDGTWQGFINTQKYSIMLTVSFVFRKVLVRFQRREVAEYALYGLGDRYREMRMEIKLGSVKE